MKAWQEQWYPLVGGAAVGVAVYFLVDLPAAAPKIEPLTTTLISVASISVGFLGTALAVLLSTPETKYIRQLKDSSAWGRLVDFVTSALHWTLVFALLSIGFLFIDLKTPDLWKQLALAAWSFVGATAALSSYRSIGLFALLLREDAKYTSKSSKPAEV